jgi:hypothetical protein
LAEVLLIKAVLNYSQNVFLLTMLYNQKKHTVKSVITQRPNYNTVDSLRRLLGFYVALVLSKHEVKLNLSC